MERAAASGSGHKLLLTVHVTASVGVLGADLALLALGLAGAGGAAPAAVYPAARLVGLSVLAPLAVAALATGVWLSISTQWGLFRYWWVAIKLAITAALTLAILFVLLPRLETAAEIATASDAVPGPRETLPLAVAPALASSLLLVAVVLGVFKPGHRLSSGGRRETRGIGFPRLYDLSMKLLTRGRERKMRERLLRLAGIDAGDDVLDVGCGTGTQALAARHWCGPCGSATGLDVSEKMLAAARRKTRRAAAEVSFHAGDASRLPFEDGRFDVVIASLVLHMVPEARREPCLDEAFRVLRPGGRLLLVDFAGAPDKRRHWSARPGRHGRFDLYRLRAPLEEAGFHDVAGGPLDWMSLHFLWAVKG